MKISHYLYNAFIIQSGDTKIAIDPGAMFLYFFSLSSLIPKSEWQGITHILVTHGDIDHYWHTDRVAEVSGAPVFVNKNMVEERNDKAYLLATRHKGLVFTTLVNKVYSLSVGERLEYKGVVVSGIKTTHGKLLIKFGPFSKVLEPGPDERIGWGP